MMSTPEADFSTAGKSLPLRNLVESLGAILRSGAADTQVSSISIDTQGLRAGGLFVAVSGLKRNGWEFWETAQKRGAAAIMTSAAGAAYLQAKACSLPVLVVSDPRSAAGLAADLIYGHPSHKLKVFGVTGTNGKSTTVAMLRTALAAFEGETAVGSIGTVGIDLGGQVVPSARTTLEAPRAHEVFAVAHQRGVKNLAIEVSSHAQTLARTSGIQFAAVGFLNLQRDHLDFHHDMESYFAAKASLFTPAYAPCGVICVDDRWGAKLAEISEIPVVTYRTTGADESGFSRADWQCQILPATGNVGTDFMLRETSTGREYRMHCPLPGRYNVQNMVMAALLCAVTGKDLQTAAQAITEKLEVPGRMEVVTHRLQNLPLSVVDYAHTTDALRMAATALRESTPGRLLLVFGATGERDRGKRPQMGRAAAEVADLVIVTDDDPYDEDVQQIRAEVISGIGEATRVTDAQEALAALDRKAQASDGGPPCLEVDGRELAIRIALELACSADTVLVAGRGHETIQMVKGVPLKLDDREVIRDYYRNRK